VIILNGFTLIGIEQSILLLKGEIVVMFCVLKVDETHKHLTGARFIIVFDINILFIEY
jgi:hypothetical protein